MNCRHAVNAEIPILRAGQALAQLATGIFQSLSVCRMKWQQLRTLVIFLAAKNSQAAVGGKSLANSSVVLRSFWKAAYHGHGVEMLQKLELVFRTQSKLLQLGRTTFL